MTALVSNWFLGLTVWFGALINWRRVVWLAMCQVMLGLSRRNRLGLIWALAEPLVAISLVYAVRGLLRMRGPEYGTSTFLFFATGFLPYYLFIRLSTRIRVARMGPGTSLPGVSSLDEYIATILVNAVIWITMIVVLFLGMWWVGDIEEVGFIDIPVSAVPLLLLIALATGIGLLNGAISRYIPFWVFIYSILTRGLLFLSGVLQIVDLQSLSIRQYAILNPLSHAIEWFRLGVWERYPHNSLDEDYLITWVVVCLFLGLVVDRASLRTLSRQR
ncbi:MAG: hypothetical protein EPO10_09140 [Reyranella sp.]|uniref:ABC transporter permease n=1 Tax=Reyranella sp. TaxID=1929291 RepID=UPI001208FFF8|nr:ABC transporter permease [Reyranella sp.]TAJ92139.1 MAG: hypothetical protein EPO41_14620 [Reyranella sp.]TBR29199.1 MAG: hypothetical protein EPO10_09140 [Reyranella sp.]